MLAATTEGESWGNRELSAPEEFEELKKNGKLLYGQVPMLEIDGLYLTQAQAIIRYLAAKHGLLGSTPQEAALCDMVAEGCLEFRGGLLSYPFNPVKVATQQSLGLINKFCPIFEKMLGDNQYIAGSTSMTYADILLAEVLTGYEEVFPTAMEQHYPKLNELRVRVCQAASGIVNYLASGKRYPFPTGEAGSAYVHNVRAVLNG